MRTAKLSLVVDNTKPAQQGFFDKVFRWDNWRDGWQKADAFLLKIVRAFCVPFLWLRWMAKNTLNLMRVIYLGFWWCLIRLVGLVLLCLTLNALYQIAAKSLHHFFL